MTYMKFGIKVYFLMNKMCFFFPSSSLIVTGEKSFEHSEFILFTIKNTKWEVTFKKGRNQIIRIPIDKKMTF